MTTPTKKQLSDTLSKTAVGLTDKLVERLGFGVLAFGALWFVWDAGEKRAVRMEKMMESNATTLAQSAKTSAEMTAVLVKLSEAWERHDATAKNFISNITDDVKEIKAATTARQ